MRACELGMPSVWLPDIDPEASNTITASSVQGEGFFSSSLLPAPLSAITVVNAMTDNKKKWRLLARSKIIAQDRLADFSRRNMPPVSLRVAVESHRAEANPSPWCVSYAGPRG